MSTNLNLDHRTFAMLISGRRGPKAWSGFFLAQRRRTIAVLVFGACAVTATILIPVGFSHFSDSIGQSEGMLASGLGLMVAVVSSFVFGWFKERSELRLVFGTRMLAFRSFFDDAMRGRSGRSVNLVGEFTTHPPQISQVSYVLDFGLSLAQAVGIACYVAVVYQLVGWIALAGLVLVTAVSVRLVHAVGKVYEKFIALESNRVERIRDISTSVHALRNAKLDRFISGWMQRARERQEPVLRERARLQVLNGIVSTTAVPVVVGIAAIATAVGLGGSLISLVPLLVASTLLYSALQEVIVNYRVIRLAVPMLRAWDERRIEADEDDHVRSVLPSDPGVTWISMVDHPTLAAVSAEAMRSAVEADHGWVPADPRLPAAVAADWYLTLNDAERDAFHEWIEALELPGDLHLDVDASRIETLSRGELHRLAIAAVLATTEGPCVLDAECLAALDPGVRARATRNITARGRPLVLIGGDLAGPCADRRYAASLDNEELKLEARPLPTLSPLSDETAVDRLPDMESSESETGAGDPVFPSPTPTVRGSVRIWTTIFGGAGATVIVVAALASAGLAVCFPVVLNAVDGSAPQQRALQIGLVTAGILSVGLVALGLQFHTPIKRITLLHRRIGDRLKGIAGPRRTGELVGRYGEDFSALQMEAPGQLVAALAICAEVGVFAIAAGLGSPLLLPIIVMVLPAAWFVYRRGERRLVAATTAQAKQRGHFLDDATAILGEQLIAGNASIRAAARTTYARAEAGLEESSISVVTAMMRRRTELQSVSVLVLVLGLSASALLSAFGGALVPVVLAYFIYSIALQLPRLIESVQRVSVAMTAAERVMALLESADVDKEREPVHHTSAVAEIEAALAESDHLVLRVAGRSGAGKSVALRALNERLPNADVSLIGDDIPVKSLSCNEFPAPERSTETRTLGDLVKSERQALLAEYAIATSVGVTMLDETLSAMSASDQELMLARLREIAKQESRSFVYVSHTAADSIGADRTILVER